MSVAFDSLLPTDAPVHTLDVPGSFSLQRENSFRGPMDPKRATESHRGKSESRRSRGGDGRPNKEVKRYLQGSLGQILSQCVAELCQIRPEDPIDYLARWLYNYADSRLYMEEKIAYLNALTETAGRLRLERFQRDARRRAMRKEAKEMRTKLCELDPATCGKLGISSDNSLFLSQVSLVSEVSHLKNLHLSQYADRMHKAQSQQSKMFFHSPSPSTRGGSLEFIGDHLYKTDKKSTYGSGSGSAFASGYGSPYGSLYGTRYGSGYESPLGDDDGKRRGKLHAHWILEENMRMVCVHPLLGRLRGTGPSSPKDRTLQWINTTPPCPSLYEHEIYICLYLPESFTQTRLDDLPAPDTPSSGPSKPDDQAEESLSPE